MLDGDEADDFARWSACEVEALHDAYCGLGEAHCFCPGRHVDEFAPGVDEEVDDSSSEVSVWVDRARCRCGDAGFVDDEGEVIGFGERCQEGAEQISETGFEEGAAWGAEDVGRGEGESEFLHEVSSWVKRTFLG